MFKVKNFEKPIFYLYALVCPIENEIKYIGMSKSPKTRFKQHLRWKYDNAKKFKWINDLKDVGLEPKLIIINSYKDRMKAVDAELEYISKYRETIFNTTVAVKYPLTPDINSLERLKMVTMSMDKEHVEMLKKISKKHLISNEKMIEFLIRDKFENTFINK